MSSFNEGKWCIGLLADIDQDAAAWSDMIKSMPENELLDLGVFITTLMEEINQKASCRDNVIYQSLNYTGQAVMREYCKRKLGD